MLSTSKSLGIEKILKNKYHTMRYAIMGNKIIFSKKHTKHEDSDTNYIISTAVHRKFKWQNDKSRHKSESTS